MEKSVTIRFYDVNRPSEDRPLFAEVIAAIAAKPVKDREAFVGADAALVRLEDVSQEQGEISGQFIRGQSSSRPGQMLDNGTETIPFPEPLGHGIAFRYRTATGLLALQFDNRTLSPSKIISYLRHHVPRADYDLVPRLRSDAWERLEAFPLRKFEVAIAGHPNPADMNDGNRAVLENVARMKQAYEANIVRIQVSMGHKKGNLAEAAKSFLRDLFQRYSDGEADIRSLKGVISQDEKSDEIDLLGELFDRRETFEITNDNFHLFYEFRRALLQRHMADIQ